MIKPLLVFFIGILPLWTGTANKDFSATISLSKDKLRVDETLEITVKLTYPPSHTIDLDRMRLNILKYVGFSEPPFALISEKRKELPDEGMELTFLLEPLIEGVHFLSFYAIEFPPVDESTDKAQVIISEIFKVETVLAQVDENFQGTPYPLLSLTKKFPITLTMDNRLRLLEDPKILSLEARRNNQIIRSKTFPWPELGGILLILLVVLFIRMQPKRPPDLEKQKRKKARSARRKALQALATLEKEKLPQQYAFDLYFVTLSETVRRYIEEAFQMATSTQTTNEFLNKMAKNPSFDLQTQQKIKEFLLQSDRVKFAEHQPTLNECKRAHEIAKRLISK